MNRGQLPRHGCNTIASLNLEFRRESGWGGFSWERLRTNPRSKWESQVARDFDSLAIDVCLIKLFHAVLAQRQTKRKTFSAAWATRHGRQFSRPVDDIHAAAIFRERGGEKSCYRTAEESITECLFYAGCRQ